MDKNQTSQGARAGVLSTRNLQLFGARSFLLTLLLALSLTSLQPVASAQSCVQRCQQEYVACLRAGHGLICDDTYDACWQSCM